MRKITLWTACEVDNRNSFVDAIGKEVFIVYHENNQEGLFQFSKME